MQHGFNLSKSEIKWLARQFGYRLRWLGDLGWNQHSIEFLVIERWGQMFGVCDYIDQIIVHKRNIQLRTTSEIVYAMALRTISRPYLGLPRRIWDKEIESPFNGYLDSEYPYADKN